jgi:hypothetical protein
MNPLNQSNPLEDMDVREVSRLMSEYDDHINTWYEKAEAKGSFDIPEASALTPTTTTTTPTHQPREHSVPCGVCKRQTWERSAICAHHKLQPLPIHTRYNPLDDLEYHVSEGYVIIFGIPVTREQLQEILAGFED